MRILASFAVCLLLSACATIFGKTNYNVAIDSEPSGAEVLIYNRAGAAVFRGTTPASANLVTKHAYFQGERYRVVMTKGDAKGEGTIVPSINGWYFGNLLLGGAIGMLILDPLTGAMYRLPDSFQVQLRNGAASIDMPMQLQIVAIDALSAEIRAQLVRLQ